MLFKIKKMNAIILFFLLISFTNELIFDNIQLYEINEYFNLIEKINISKEDSEKLILSLTKILDRYVFLDILKNPPQPKENYHNRVDLIKELKNVNFKERPLLYFYRDVKKIIDKCQDLHLNILLNKNLESNLIFINSYLISPLFLKIIDKEVYSLKNDFKFAEQINIYEGQAIKSINGLNPIEYIQQFNGDFLKVKSPQAQFVLNQKLINNPIPFNGLPLDISNLTNIHIIYNDNTELFFNYRIIYIEKGFLSYIFNVVFDFFSNIINVFYENINFFEKEKWDSFFDEGNLKCTVDHQNKVNVIFQNTFHTSNLTESIKFFDECFLSFDKNSYPLVIIESFNNGGYAELTDSLFSYINLNQSSKIYSSLRYNDEVKKNIAPLFGMKSIESCEIKNCTDLFNSTFIEDYYGRDEKGNKIFHKRTKIYDLTLLDENYFYHFRRKTRNIRKPHEIIIFTDGFSYSATSVLIKETQLKGGAIIVGYDGNPYLDNFDASQSPSSVFFTLPEEGAKDDLSVEIESLGFSLSYTISESFSEPDYINKDTVNIPLEYQIHEIDERVQLYNGYDDSKYQDFIDEALKIFSKYKIRCNPKNKKLLFISDKCKFSDFRMHGGYECDNNGFWSNKCVPSYCDSGYIYSKIENKCIKDICIKKKSLIRKILDIEINKPIAIIVLFGLFQILSLFFIFSKKYKKKRIFFISILGLIDLILVMLLYFIN